MPLNEHIRQLILTAKSTVEVRKAAEDAGLKTLYDDGWRLVAEGATTVSGVGGSFGGGAAADAAVVAKPGEIDRLVLLAHSSIDHPERMQGRKLFITTHDDPYADGSPRLIAIRKQYERAPEPKRLVVLEGSAHAQHVFATEQGERLLQEILKFLSEP